MQTPLFLLAATAASLVARTAYAGMFSSVGSTFMDMGRSVVEDLGLPITFCSVAWALLAIKFRLGGMAMAMTGIIAGVALMNAETLVTAFWSHHLMPYDDRSGVWAVTAGGVRRC